MSDDAFFTVLEAADDALTVRTQQHAVGPWDAGSLHAGPPTALCVSWLDQHHPADDRCTTRVSVEILRPVPVGVLTVQAEVLRPGRKVELLRATLRDEQGTDLMSAAVWRIRQADQPLGVGVEGQPLPGPDGVPPATSTLREVGHTGYMQAVEVRFLEGDWGAPGPATAWMRPRVPLRDDQPIRPLERLLVIADSGNGISSRHGSGQLSRDALFVNVDLGVHLTRPPEGEWMGMQAQTILTDHGIGLATTVLHDRMGPVGRGNQSLIVQQP